MSRPVIAGAALLLIEAVAIAQVARPLPAPVRPSPPAVARPLTAPVPPVSQPGPDYWVNNQHNPGQARYFAGTTRCESQNFQPRNCRARTENRVEIVQVHGGSCARGRSFTYTADQIRVTDGCRATFAYGFGNVRPQASSGPNALPWLLAGAGATAGIYAIANSGSNNPHPPEPRPAPVPAPVEPAPPPPPVQQTPAVPQPPFPALPPAKIVANTQMLTADQQRTMQTCLFEGARQVGLAGGTVMTLSSIDRIEQGNGGWRFTVRGSATFPNGERPFSVFCRATPTQIVEFSVTPLALPA